MSTLVAAPRAGRARRRRSDAVPAVREHDATATGGWTDARLQASLVAQVPEAVEILAHRYGPRTYRLALRITGSPDDAREIAQDVLWTVARKIDSFRGESALGSWIHRITVNAAYQALRRRRVQAEVSWDEVLPTFGTDGRLVGSNRDWSRTISDPAIEAEVRRRLAEAVETLPPDYRTVFVLHDLEELPNPEIAHLLGLSLPAVKSRVHRSRLLLRKRLADYFDHRH